MTLYFSVLSANWVTVESNRHRIPPPVSSSDYEIVQKRILCIGLFVKIGYFFSRNCVLYFVLFIFLFIYFFVKLNHCSLLSTNYWQSFIKYETLIYDSFSGLSLDDPYIFLCSRVLKSPFSGSQGFIVHTTQYYNYLVHKNPFIIIKSSVVDSLFYDPLN